MPLSIEWAGVERVAVDGIQWTGPRSLLPCAYVAVVILHHPYNSVNDESHGWYHVILLVLTALTRGAFPRAPLITLP